MSRIREGARRAVTVVATVTAAATMATLPAVTSWAAPAAPAGLTPNDVADTQYKNLELRWSAVAGATSYEIQVSHDGLFGSQKVTGASTLTRWTVPVTLPRGDYAWRVRAKRASGTGAWSAVGYFTRGWSAAPSGVRTHAGTGPVPAVSWKPLPDASFYELEFSRVRFDAGTADYEATMGHYTCYTTHTYFQPYGVVAGTENHPGTEGSCAFDVTSDEADAAPEVDGKFHVGERYYWRVRGRDGTVDERTTAVPDPALSCAGVWFESGVEADEEGGVTVPIGGEAPAYDPKPECSRWADGGAFTVTIDPFDTDQLSDAPSGLAVEPTAGDPEAALVTVTDTPLFRWDPVAGAVKYRVYVSRTTDFRDADNVWETSGTSLRPVGTMSDRALKRYWTVQACSAHVYCGPVAATKAFTKDTAVTVAPASTSASDTQAVLTWTVQHGAVPAGRLVTGVPQAKAYQVQVARDGDFARPVLDQRVDRVADPGNTTLARHAMNIAALADGLYRWRVRPLDEAGQAMDWSATGSFRRDRAAPTVAPATGTGFGLTSAVKLRFSEPVSGVSPSTLGVKVAGTSTTVAGQLRSAGSTTWLFTPTRAWVAGEQYAVWVGAAVKDAAGKSATASSATVRATTVVDSASPAMVKTRGDYSWSTGTASDAFGGSYVRSSDRPETTARSSVRAVVRGTVLTLTGCRGPRSGRAAISVDGRRIATVDLYQPYSSCGRVWRGPTLSDRQHTVTVAVTGTRRDASRGHELAVDAIRVA